MKILIVGGGGREHALAWKLKQDDNTVEIIAAPGNPGIAEIGRIEPVRADDVQGLLDLALRESVDLAVVGPEAPLAAGIADRFNEAGIPIFGPTKAAAQIETSKRFAKQLMEKFDVPTARASHHTSTESAKLAARELGVPVVIKASGLAAGKGVIIAQSLKEADEAIDSMLIGGKFGEAGNEILIEEFMEGEELSIFAICDGSNFVMMKGAQDHKRLLDGDEGPNTGGMGAYAPVTIDTPALRETVKTRIFQRTLKGLKESGVPFRGLLYAGLMLTREGPRVVEFNCRFGDPETQALLPLMKSSLLDLMLTVGRGEELDSQAGIEWRDGGAATVVLAAKGYPDTVQTGDEITLPDLPPETFVFHAGTKLNDGKLVTAGGRVLAITTVAHTLEEASKESLEVAQDVIFKGKQMRTDIGWRELQRTSVKT